MTEDANPSVAGESGLHAVASGTPASIDASRFGDAFKSINDSMAQHSQLQGWLPKGESRLVAATVGYFDQLGKAAVEAASRRTGATAVDQGDVDTASSELSTTKAQLFAVLLAIAGVTSGAFVATLVGVLLTPPAQFAWVWWVAIAVLGIASAVLGVAAYKNRAT